MNPIDEVVFPAELVVVPRPAGAGRPVVFPVQSMISSRKQALILISDTHSRTPKHAPHCSEISYGHGSGSASPKQTPLGSWAPPSPQCRT